MASEAEQDTKLCGNCKRDIPVTNFTIHEIHCKRNISVCHVCKEPFPTSEMEEHLDTEHAPVICKCKKTLEKRALEEHERTACSLRLVKCQFCELELAFNKLEDHEDYCGARTERCEKCGRSVMHKELKDHPNVCGKVPETKKPVQDQSQPDYSEYNGSWFETLENRNAFRDDLYSRIPAHLPSRFYGNSVLTRGFERRPGERVDQNRVGGQSNLSRNIQVERREPPLEETTIQPSVRNRGQSDFNSFRSLSLQNRTRTRTDSDPLTNTNFWRDFYSKESGENKKFQRRNSANLFFDDDSVQVESPSTQSDNDIQLPCEFCEKLFPEQDLILHQSGCNPRAFATFCNRKQSPSRFTDYEEFSGWTPQQSGLNERSTSPPPPADQSNRVLIPCEFCGIQMEDNILFHHQDQCDMCPNTETLCPSSPPSYDETRFMGMLPAGLARQDNTAPSYEKNWIRESCNRQPQSVRESGPVSGLARQPIMPNLSRATFRSRQSAVEEMRRRNIEENSRLGRSHHNENYRTPFHRDSSNRDEFLFNTTASNVNSRRRPKANNLKAVPGDVDKEE
ncbi:TRAF-type zinc finger domain-containing protein 1 [Rhinophrynus dorsalis]